MARRPSPTIVAVDPGGRFTGVVVRQGRSLHAHSVVQRTEETFPQYVNWVVTRIRSLVLTLPAGYQAVACERMVSRPGWNVNTDGAFVACYVAGAVMNEFPDTILVDPAGHGKGPRSAYPEDLWGPGEVKGSGILNHCRAAWDIAEAAALIYRQRAKRRTA